MSTELAAAAARFNEGLNAFAGRYRSLLLPAEAKRRSLDAITDTFGCAVLGARQELEPRLRRALFGARVAPLDLVRLLGAGAMADASTDGQGAIALYLGTLAHAADYDDISHPAYCHASALLLPALLVRGAVIGASGAALMRAHVFGFEVLGQLGRRLNTTHYAHGWHTTGTFGALGATAALCHLENFSAPDTATAMNIAASLAGGLRQNFGTMTKPLHAGLAARSAILATRLAAEQFTSADDAIDGKYGYFKVFGGAAEPALQKDWGAPLEILTDFGIGLKAYPCCAGTHPAIDAARAVRARIAAAGGWSDDAVESVRVGASRFAMAPLIYDIAANSLEGKFSMRYCVAAALHDGTVNMTSFLDDNVVRPAVRALMQRIRVEIDPRVADDHEFAAIVDVTLKSGTTTSVRVDVASGKPGNWLDAATVKDKFFECLGAAANAGAAGPVLFDHARALEAADSVRPVINALAESIAHAAAVSGA